MDVKATHIDIYARVGENSGVRGVGWDVSVELLTIPVPVVHKIMSPRIQPCCDICDIHVGKKL